jgi:hypothetical protein
VEHKDYATAELEIAVRNSSYRDEDGSPLVTRFGDDMFVRPDENGRIPG